MKNNLITIDTLSENKNFINEIVSVTIQLVTSENFHSYPKSVHST